MTRIENQGTSVGQSSLYIQRALSLIELIVVMAIFAGLLAYSIPNYMQFMVRGKILATLHAVQPTQLAMVDYFYAHECWPNAQQLGLNPNEAWVGQQPLLSQASIHGGESSQAHIKLVFRSPHFPRDLTLYLKPKLKHQQISWACVLNAAGSQAGMQTYLPAHCRRGA